MQKTARIFRFPDFTKNSKGRFLYEVSVKCFRTKKR